MIYKYLVYSIAAGALVCACGTAEEELAETTDFGFGPGPVEGDPCLTSVADFQRTMGPNIDRVSAAGANANYATRAGCNKLIVDIIVPFNSSPANIHGLDDISLSAEILDVDVSTFSQNTCSSFRGDVWMYTAASFPLGASANPLGEYHPIRGVWGPGGCDAVLSNTGRACGGEECVLGTVSPPSSGSRTHRLLLSARSSSVYRRVRAIGQHPVVPF